MILDTNVILRFLVGDQPEQQQQASVWFEKAEQGELKLVVKSLVVAEVCFVLESFYKKSREEIADVLVVFLSQKWIQVEDREVLIALWPWYKNNFHFVDSFLLAYSAINQDQVLTFDQQMVKVSKQKK